MTSAVRKRPRSPTVFEDATIYPSPTLNLLKFASDNYLSRAERHRLLSIVKDPHFKAQDLPRKFLDLRSPKMRRILSDELSNGLSSLIPFQTERIRHPTILSGQEFVFYYRNPIEVAHHLLRRYSSKQQPLLLFGQEKRSPDTGERLYGEANTGDFWTRAQREHGIDTILLPCRCFS